MFNNSVNKSLLQKLVNSKPSAKCLIKGRDGFNDLAGIIDFFDFGNEVVLVGSISNLPITKTNIFGFHIHENGLCDSDFTSAGKHLGAGSHPNHKGDLPPLFSSNENAFLVFATNRFSINEIIGKSIIIHENPDDFTTQPSGNSGARIACGTIEKVWVSKNS